jgi:toxin-antitoxin system PIN domain toxin
MPDVNVLVAGFRTDDDQHGPVKVWLEQALNGPEVVGLSDAVAVGFLRVVTHPRIFAKPTPIDQALVQLESLWSADGLIRVVPGRSFPAVFARLCREVEAKGNLVADAAHAATAIEAGATWVSLDRDFARFPGLSWTVPRALP